MALRGIFKFRNVDSTRDFNDRFKTLFKRGYFDGGDLVTVPSQLKIDVTPFSGIGFDGMMVVNDTTERLSLLAGQTTVVVVRAIYSGVTLPTLVFEVLEQTVYDTDPQKDFLMVLGSITLGALATEVLTADIDLTTRDVIDLLGRSPFRGFLTTAAFLPLTANRDGDFYVIADGVSEPEIHAWDGTVWQNITSTAAIESLLAAHRANLFTNEIHMTDDQADAALGSDGTPDNTNRFVTESDPRLPTQDENDALVGSDGAPSASNLYLTEEKILAVPAEVIKGVPGVTPIEMTPGEGPFFVGTAGIGSAAQYFNLYLDSPYPDNDQEFVDSNGVRQTISGVFLDAGLTTPINPGVNADAQGFFGGGSLFLAATGALNVATKVLYGLRVEMGSMPVSALIRRGPQSADRDARNPAQFIALARIMQENLNILFYNDGDINWTTSTDDLTFVSSFFIDIPFDNVFNEIPIASSPINIPTSGDRVYVQLTRTPGSGTVDISGTLTVVAKSGVPPSNDAFILCWRIGTSIWFRDGTRFADGDTKKLGESGAGGGGSDLDLADLDAAAQNSLYRSITKDTFDDTTLVDPSSTAVILPGAGNQKVTGGIGDFLLTEPLTPIGLEGQALEALPIVIFSGSDPLIELRNDTAAAFQTAINKENIVFPSALAQVIEDFEAGGGFTGSTDVTNIHDEAFTTRQGARATVWDKTGGTETESSIAKTFGSPINAAAFATEDGVIWFNIPIDPATSGVTGLFVQLESNAGADTSRWNKVAGLVSGWNAFVFDLTTPDATGGGGVNFANIEAITVGINFGLATDTLVNIRTDGLVFQLKTAELRMRLTWQAADTEVFAYGVLYRKRATGQQGINLFEEFIATAAQTVFDLSAVGESYTPGTSQIKVFSSGILQSVGASNDYVETDPVTVTFNTGRLLGERVVIQSQLGFFTRDNDIILNQTPLRKKVRHGNFLEWVSTTEVQIGPGVLGFSEDTRIRENDAAKLVDISTTGVGGRAQAAVAIQTSQTYFIYAVPNPFDYDFVIDGDLTGAAGANGAPIEVGGLGPTGFSNHRYIGSFVTDGGGLIREFLFVDGFYQYIASYTALNVFPAGAPPVYPAALVIRPFVPETSQRALLHVDLEAASRAAGAINGVWEIRPTGSALVPGQLSIDISALFDDTGGVGYDPGPNRQTKQLAVTTDVAASVDHGEVGGPGVVTDLEIAVLGYWEDISRYA